MEFFPTLPEKSQLKSIGKICFRPESLLFALLLLITYNFTWQKDNWQNNILSSDGRGYYAYLPAFLIYQDLTYESNSIAIEEQMGYEMGHHYILENEDGKTFNKCFPGVAICLTPLFLLATFLSYLTGGDINGYSDIYMLAIQFSAIFSCIIGYFFLKKLLILKKVNVILATLIPLIGIFATNVYFYACAGASMGHIYSFMMIAMFLYYSQKTINSGTLKNYIISAFALAIIMLIRPTNGIVLLLLPFLAGSAQTFFEFVKVTIREKKKLLALILTGGITLSLLPFLWWLQTGHFVVWSYTGEGFYFTKPLFHKVLFSFRNGMFIYAPIAILLFGGMVVLFRKNRFAGIMTFLYFSINLYIISSWWIFNYGGGFGHRAMSEHHVFTILMIAILVQEFEYGIRKVFWALSVVLTSLSIFQGYQITKGILPNDYVNAEMYGLLFLKWDDKYIGECNATLDIPQFGEVSATKYLRPKQFESEPSVLFDADREFGADAEFVVPKLNKHTHLFLDYNFKKKRISETIFNDVFLVIVGENKDGLQQFYQSCNLYQIRSEAFNEFKQLQMTLQLPKKDIVKFKFYIWNRGRQTFVLEDIDIRIQLIEP